MKKLSIEEKAMAYDKAIEKARKVYNNISPENSSVKKILEKAFPELKENEDENTDEKVRKALIKLVTNHASIDLFIEYDIHLDEALSWLEKQGEQKSLNDVIKEVTKNKETAMSFLKSCGIMNANGELADEYKIEQGEKKSFDYESANIQQKDFVPKVESKFHKGDWVVRGGTIAQILDVQEQYYVGLDINGKDFTSSRFLNDDKIHLWTIEDAKNGDVLASELCDSIILFRGIKDDNIDFYCDYDFSKIDIPGDRFAVNNGQHYGNVEDSKDFHPATKEQRDTLMKAMADAGWQFDFEKKEFKKIEKACSFFRQSHHLYTLDGVELQHFIDDFRKVMKGE